MPVYSFGENELFRQVIFSDGSLGRRLQDLFKKIMGFAPCLFVGERLALLPYRTPITTVGEYFMILQIVNIPNLLSWAHFILTLRFFQWEVPSQCQNVPHLLRRRSTNIIDFTWRACPSYSMNTRSTADFQKVTSFRSFRRFTSAWIAQLCFYLLPLMTTGTPSKRAYSVQLVWQWIWSFEFI